MALITLTKINFTFPAFLEQSAGHILATPWKMGMGLWMSNPLVVLARIKGYAVIHICPIATL